MNKNFILNLLIIVLILHFFDVFSRKQDATPSTAPTITTPKELTYEEILDLIKNENVKKYVETLASKEFDGRATGTEGNIKAANYIKQHLDSLKIPYKEQEFSVRGKNTKNIIGYLIPKNIKSEKIIVIGAHFDHLGTNYPGADDNGSGTAGLMAIATALNKYKHKLNNTVLLQFYSGEEQGLLGSKYYTEHPLFPENNPDINKHFAMINLDMIGYLRKNYMSNENVTSYKNYKEWIVFNYRASIDLKSIVSELSSKYSFAKNISGYRPGGSDHAPFYNKGIPVVFLHTGSHANYHKPSDTPDKLNYDGLVNVSKLALEILVRADKDL